MRETLLDPSLALKTDAQEDERPGDPMIWASDTDWQELAVILVKRNICELVEFNEIAEVNGRKMLGDLIGVAKGGNDREHLLPASHHEHQGTQLDQHVISGDMPQLHSSGQWRCLVSENGETLVWSGEDLKYCFYVFEIPKPWRRWMAFAAPVARSCFFRCSTGVVCLSSKVVPMG